GRTPGAPRPCRLSCRPGGTCRECRRGGPLVPPAGRLTDCLRRSGSGSWRAWRYRATRRECANCTPWMAAKSQPSTIDDIGQIRHAESARQAVLMLAQAIALGGTGGPSLYYLYERTRASARVNAPLFHERPTCSFTSRSP